MKKIAIIGASYLQVPLIKKAKEMEYETHVFAWEVGDEGELIADYFYPISIVEKEEILKKCQEIKIDGICSIASDLAVITVNYVAFKMGLPCNPPECVVVSTNKHNMRKCFEFNGDPSPKSVQVSSAYDLKDIQLNYPIIVKPVDRSGSRGITKLYDAKGLAVAIENAKEQGFEKVALVEEYATGQEYSVEYISYQGKHNFLAVTHKFTTGSPNYIERAHLEPAPISSELLEEIKKVTEHAITSLGIVNGASHTELKVSENGDIKLIEIGGRMGGDCIGSSLVELSTGYDFVKGVIEVAMGIEPNVIKNVCKASAVRFIFDEKDVEMLKKIKNEHAEYIVFEDVHSITDDRITDSSSRFGYYILQADSAEELIEYVC